MSRPWQVSPGCWRQEKWTALEGMFTQLQVRLSALIQRQQKLRKRYDSPPGLQNKRDTPRGYTQQWGINHTKKHKHEALIPMYLTGWGDYFHDYITHKPQLMPTDVPTQAVWIIHTPHMMSGWSWCGLRAAGLWHTSYWFDSQTTNEVKTSKSSCPSLNQQKDHLF